MTRLIAFLCLLPVAGFSDVVGPGGKTIDCYCTDTSGSRVELRQTICLQVDGRLFMAQCQMSLNVPMWREVADSCLSSSADPTGSTEPIEPAIHAPLVHAQI